MTVLESYNDSSRDESMMVNKMKGVVYNPYFNDITNGIGIFYNTGQNMMENINHFLAIWHLKNLL